MRLIARAGSVVWSGPIDVFAFDAFGKCTEAVARMMVVVDAFSNSGDGDTVASVNKH